MDKEKFVVVDFTVRPVEEQPLINSEINKIDWEAAARRVTQRVKDMLIKQLPNKRGRTKAAIEGLLDEDRNYASVVVVRAPTMRDISIMEDALRTAVPDTNIPIIRVKVQDKKTGSYVFMEAIDFNLNGPSGGEWKPFTGWYRGAKSLGIPVQ